MFACMHHCTRAYLILFISSHGGGVLPLSFIVSGK